MEHSESRIAPSPEAASDDFVSPCNQQPGPAEPAGQASPGGPRNDRAYWAGVADGLRRAGVAVPPDIAALAGTPPGDPSDRLAFEPAPLRYREDGLTPERQRAYVEALADTGVAREAAARVGLSEQAINRVRRRADARSFDLACEAAHRLGARQLRSIAYQRAVEGTRKGHYYHGELISEERVHDNRLLIYLLGKTEHLLDPPEESRGICENWEPYMDALERGLPAPDLAPPRSESRAVEFDAAQFEGYDHDLWEEHDIWWTSFPPPDGFDGEEEGAFGDEDYRRTLSAEEQAVVDADVEAELAELRATEAARRDRFFDFEREEILSPREAEPCGTSGDDGPPRGPIEFKSMPRGRSSPAGEVRPAADSGGVPRPDRLWTPSPSHPLRRTDRAASASNG